MDRAASVELGSIPAVADGEAKLASARTRSPTETWHASRGRPSRSMPMEAGRSLGRDWSGGSRLGWMASSCLAGSSSWSLAPLWCLIAATVSRGQKRTAPFRFFDHCFLPEPSYLSFAKKRVTNNCREGRSLTRMAATAYGEDRVCVRRHFAYSLLLDQAAGRDLGHALLSAMSKRNGTPVCSCGWHRCSEKIVGACQFVRRTGGRMAYIAEPICCNLPRRAHQLAVLTNVRETARVIAHRLATGENRRFEVSRGLMLA